MQHADRDSKPGCGPRNVTDEQTRRIGAAVEESFNELLALMAKKVPAKR